MTGLDRFRSMRHLLLAGCGGDASVLSTMGVPNDRLILVDREESRVQEVASRFPGCDQYHGDLWDATELCHDGEIGSLFLDFCGPLDPKMLSRMAQVVRGMPDGSVVSLVFQMKREHGESHEWLFDDVQDVWQEGTSNLITEALLQGREVPERLLAPASGRMKTADSIALRAYAVWLQMFRNLRQDPIFLQPICTSYYVSHDLSRGRRHGSPMVTWQAVVHRVPDLLWDAETIGAWKETFRPDTHFFRSPKGQEALWVLATGLYEIGWGRCVPGLLNLPRSEWESALSVFHAGGEDWRGAEEIGFQDWDEVLTGEEIDPVEHVFDGDLDFAEPESF